jgi:hypothetical protein
MPRGSDAFSTAKFGSEIREDLLDTLYKFIKNMGT